MNKYQELHKQVKSKLQTLEQYRQSGKITEVDYQTKKRHIEKKAQEIEMRLRAEDSYDDELDNIDSFEGFEGKKATTQIQAQTVKSYTYLGILTTIACGLHLGPIFSWMSAPNFFGVAEAMISRLVIPSALNFILMIASLATIPRIDNERSARVVISLNFLIIILGLVIGVAGAGFGWTLIGIIISLITIVLAADARKKLPPMKKVKKEPLEIMLISLGFFVVAIVVFILIYKWLTDATGVSYE